MLALDAILSTANNVSHAPDQKLAALIDNKALISRIQKWSHHSLAGTLAIEKRLAAQPAITVPSITFDGADDGVRPPAMAAQQARYFTGPRVHHLVPSVGHNLPQEVPQLFADAVLELVVSWRNDPQTN